MKKATLISIISLTLVSTQVIGQNNKNIAQPELESGTIEQQFDYIITKSSKFKDFQLIRKTSILKVKANTLDSLKTIRKELINANKSISQIEGNISQLKNEVNTLNNEIESISVEVDSISFFGTPLSKSAYNVMVWSIIVILLLALIILIMLYKKSGLASKHSKISLEKTENEFEAFRKKSLKKEQETMRKLQDEINKNNP